MHMDCPVAELQMNGCPVAAPSRLLVGLALMGLLMGLALTMGLPVGLALTLRLPMALPAGLPLVQSTIARIEKTRVNFMWASREEFTI